ncbi:DUF4349 domain-containing protein [Isoptericola sp. BMS4]|uniref:DUF4349 domain-containing protein n=1 Tax=Isoptericola sp. BMS4 TaxID=2527875 RepID=UPI00141ED2D6|nr:DUF4349 domain-containing protein [Isoptericola sp. BMS4]
MLRDTPPRTPVRRTAALAWLTGVLVLALAACSGGGADSGAESSSADSGASLSAPEGGDAGSAGDEAAFGQAEAPSDTDAAAASERQVITTGHATVVTDDPVAAAGELARLVEEAGGRVERRQETRATGDSPASASLTVRVPADRMTSAVEALGTLGEVEDVQLDSEDVTGQAQDLDARIAALRTSTQRLRGLMADASSTADLLEVEQELSERQADLDALTAQRQRLADEVAMSTLDVALVAEPVAAVQSGGGFLGGLSSGWNALVTTAQAVVLVLGVLLPWLGLGLLGYLGYRWVRRSRRSRTDGGPGPDDDGGTPGAPDGPHDGGDAAREPDVAAARS